MPLPAIPVVDIGAEPPLALAQRDPARVETLRRTCLGGAPTPLVRLADAASRRWLKRTANPYRGEIEQVSQLVGRPGAVVLNCVYEWSCSSAAAPDPENPGTMRLMRTLDWGFPGLGQELTVLRWDTPAGPLIEATWPGALGALTALVPGRFAVALNQAPLRRAAGWLPLDMMASWRRVWRKGGLPAIHLLRQVCETAPDFETAVARLSDPAIRVSIPAFFILAGLKPGEACVIERLETSARVHRGEDGAVTNDWLSPDLTGRPRGQGTDPHSVTRDCALRREALIAARAAPWGFEWVAPPIRNPATRVAALANPATADFMLQGFEPAADRKAPAEPATEVWRGTAVQAAS